VWGAAAGGKIPVAMKQAHAGLVLVVSTFAGSFAAGAAETPLRAAAGPGIVIKAPDGKAPAEEVRLSGDLARRLLAVKVGDAVTVADWPVAVGRREDVRLERYDIYAPEAVVYRVDADKLTPMPRSALVFLWGKAVGSDTHVLAIVDSEAGTVTGSAHSTSGASELRVAKSKGKHVVAATEAFLAGQHTSWNCAGSEEVPGRPDLDDVPEPASPGGPLHTATIGVDTDNELLNLKFGNNTTAASNYIASLFASMNVIYERDLGVRLLVGTTFLRPSTVPDPYSATTTSGTLQEVLNYWSSTCGAPCSAPRALAAILSGKSGSPNSAAGVAYVDVLCSVSNGYSANYVFRIDYLAGDTMLVGHEIGHNFGSSHTHCTPPSPVIDNCYNQQGGANCYAGPTSCPAQSTYNGVSFRGSIMSYCHITPSGCSAGPVFHPRTVNEKLAGDIGAAVGICLFQALGVTSVDPNSGSTAGGLRVTVRGSGFASGAAVTFGGVAGTAVTVVNPTTITVTTPAHAAGIVDVVVTIPGPATATLTGGFFYQTPLASTRYYTVAPCRAIDTRNTNAPPLAAGSTREFIVAGAPAGACNLPANAVAVEAIVTSARNTQNGHFTLFPANGLMPNASTINFKGNVTRANNAVVLLATNGTGRIKAFNGSTAPADLIVDILGYFR
jgi:hypothetical protein